MEINTHKKINKRLWGSPVNLEHEKALVELILTEDFAADEYGLIHGGTIFGLADYAAMLAVNHPNVVLAKADVKFLKPCVVGDKVVAVAEIIDKQDKKNRVKVEVKKGEEVVFVGEFLCIVPSKHVLSK